MVAPKATYCTDPLLSFRPQGWDRVLAERGRRNLDGPHHAWTPSGCASLGVKRCVARALRTRRRTCKAWLRRTRGVCFPRFVTAVVVKNIRFQRHPKEIERILQLGRNNFQENLR